MRFSIILSVLAALAGPLKAECGGTDLIAELPQEQLQTLEARAGNTAYGEGLLWKAEKDDTSITLFGTYHFRHAATEAHLEQLIPVIEAADAIYLEVSNADQRKLQEDMAHDPSIMFLTEGPSLIDLLGEEDWQVFKAAMEERQIPGFMAAKFKPMWAAILLGIGPCETRSGALDGEGIDKQVGDYAAAIGNPSRSLEDYRALLTMLDTFPQEDQLDMIRLFFGWAGDADDMAYTLRQRYLAEEIAIIWEFSRLLTLETGGADAEEDFARMEDMMLTRRNAGWIDVLMADALGKDVLVAVGAAHLPGEVGVLHLLEKQGFTITRLPFNP